MTIIDAILHCDSDDEVYELLNVYLDAVHLAERTDTEARYPLANTMDLMQQMRTLFIALGLVSRRLDDDSRILIKEALSVLNVAWDRLRLLAGARERTDAVRGPRCERVDPDYLPEHGRRRSDRDSRCSLA